MTSIDTEISATKLSLYPKPTNGQLWFNSKVDAVMVYDNLGNLVLKEKGNNNELNIDHLGSGVYLIGLWMGDGVVYERVVKL